MPIFDIYVGDVLYLSTADYSYSLEFSKAMGDSHVLVRLVS